MTNTKSFAPFLPLADEGLRSNRTKNVLEILWIWTCRIRSRRALAKLDAHHLADIGWTEAEVHAEVTKPFWKA